MSRLPASVFAPWPEPGTDGRMSDEDKRKYRMRVDLDDKESKRVVVVTEEGVPPNLFIVIRIFDGNGKLIRMQRKTGKFKRAIFNEDTGEKTFLVESEGILQWIVLDIQDGSIVTDSRFGLQLDLPVVSIERVGNHVVVIQRWRNGGWIRVQIYSTDGQLQNVFDIPGSYVTSTTNGLDVKAIVFQDRDTVYQDMLKIETGTGGTVVRGLPQNGLAGKHQHLQYDKVSGKQRFVEVVYFKARDETTIRILDENGNLVNTIVAKGKYRHHLKHRNKKIFIIERDGFTDAYVINLITARQEQVTSRSGHFRRISVTLGGKATLITDKFSVDFQVR